MMRGTPLHGVFRRFLALFFIAFATFVFAEDGDQVFEKNKEQILKNTCTVLDGYVFSTGTINDPQSKSVNISFEKAKLKAAENIIYYIKSFVDWPQEMDEKTRKMIWDEFVKTTTIKIELQKATSVFRERGNDNFTIVLCCPQDLVKAEKYTFPTIKSTLLNPDTYRSGAVRISVCIEMLDDYRIDARMLEVFAQKTAKEYGENVGQVIRGKNACSFLPREKTELSSLNMSQLLSLLDRSPYDPEICYFLGMKMRENLFPKTANIFFNRGAVASSFDKDFAEKCKKEITLPLACETKLPVFPEMLSAPFADTVSFEAESLKFLAHSAGLLPVGTNDNPEDERYLAAKTEFANNELEKAFVEFCASAAEKLTFSACNMAGNAGRRIDKKNEAAVLLLHAASIDPSSPYPWVHLAWIYKEKNLEEQKAFCLEKIKSLQQDAWTSDQLKLLEQTTNNTGSSDQ